MAGPGFPLALSITLPGRFPCLPLPTFPGIMESLGLALIICMSCPEMPQSQLCSHLFLSNPPRHTLVRYKSLETRATQFCSYQGGPKNRTMSARWHSHPVVPCALLGHCRRFSHVLSTASSRNNTCYGSRLQCGKSCSFSGSFPGSTGKPGAGGAGARWPPVTAVAWRRSDSQRLVPWDAREGPTPLC